MHFSMAMEPPAFWLVRGSMLVGKPGRANDASDRPGTILQSSISLFKPPLRRSGAKTRTGRLPKIFVSPWPVTISQAIKVTKWSTLMGDLNVNEANAEQVSGESGSVDAEPVVSNSSDAQPEPVTAAAQSVPETSHVESPDLVPEQGATGETVAMDAPKAEAAKADAPKVEAPKADAPRIPGKIMIMSNDEHSWDNHGVGPEAESEQPSGVFGKRRFVALAAVVALAVVAGALGGALATAGLSHFTSGDAPAAPGNQALEASVGRIDADVQALKVSVDHTSKLGMSQFNKTSERLDKVEKAQIEPAAKLAKLSEAVEKLHAAPPPAPVPVAAAAPAPAKDVTGSISAPAAAPAAAPKIEVARLPPVEGWLLRDVANGGAVIEGRQGIFEVYAGDLVPGLGRVDAIRRQDGRWVVVTSRGLIVAR
jgi:hypothetical protein